MKKVYEVWDDADCGLTLGSLESIRRLRSQGLLAATAKLLHRIEADTWEEALAVHHIKMGFEPYKPVGKAADCPNGCGGKYYPEGSGECPNCGPISSQIQR